MSAAEENMRVWCPDDDDEPKEPNWAGVDAASAARLYAEKRYFRCDYPDEQTIHVRDRDGNLTRWTIEAETTVQFWSCEERGAR